MQFRYVGEEITEWFGFKWVPGTVHEVEDAHAIGKLKNSALFEKVETPATQQYADIVKPRGRPRKVVEIEAETHGDDQD